MGVNSLYTVGIWIGNPGGENMADLNDVGNAAAILRDIFLCLQNDWDSGEISKPEGIVKRIVCPLSGGLVTAACPNGVEEYFDENLQPVTFCSYHVSEAGIVRVMYPEVFKNWAIKNNPAEKVEITQHKNKKISFPQRGDYFYISEAVPTDTQVITFEVMGFQQGDEIELFLNDKLYKRISYPGVAYWGLERGDHILTLKQNGQLIDSVPFVVR
jgi:membrane carboxypeptidase/penicillin-binding protein PbpC